MKSLSELSFFIFTTGFVTGSFSAVCCFIILFSRVLSAQVAVIAHKSVPIDQISKKQLLDLYTGDIRQWENRKPVIVFDLKTKGEVKEMFYDFLGKSPSRMKSIWLKKMLSGEGDPPKSLSSEDDMLKHIKKKNRGGG